MPASIPDNFANLFRKKSLAFMACRLKDGTLLVNPVWVDYDGSHVLINTAEGRVKDKALRRDPTVTVCIADPDNPYRYLEVRGRVEEITEKGASEHIDTLSHRYIGKDYPNRRPGEVREILRIRPERVNTFGE